MATLITYVLCESWVSYVSQRRCCNSSQTQSRNDDIKSRPTAAYIFRWCFPAMRRFVYVDCEMESSWVNQSRIWYPVLLGGMIWMVYFWHALEHAPLRRSLCIQLPAINFIFSGSKTPSPHESHNIMGLVRYEIRQRQCFHDMKQP